MTDIEMRDRILPLSWSAIDWSAIRRFRRDRAREAMRLFKLDALVVFEYANCRYLADLRPLWAPNFLVRQAVVMTAQSENIICFVHQDDAPHRRRIMDWVPAEFVRPFPTGAVSQSASSTRFLPLADALRELGCETGRVGVDIGTTSSLRSMETVLDGAEIADGNPAMHWARRVKADGEIEAMRLGSHVVDLALEVAGATVAAGVRECEVLAEVMRVYYRHGAEVPQCNLIVCSGPNTAPMQRYAGERQIQTGDLVFMDIGACFHGIFTEATRTVICGKPNDQQRAIYQTAMRVHEAVIASLTPGASLDAVHRAVLSAAGATPYGAQMQKMVIAHGIGVGYAEPPFVPPPGGPALDFTVEAGMTLAVVPTFQVPDVPGGGGVRLEDIVTVGQQGPEVLTRAPYDAALLG